MGVRVALAVTLLAFTASAGRPVVGIFPTKTNDGYLNAYKEWLAQEGADSIQLPETFDDAKLEELFQSTNGFLIPGGGEGLIPSAKAMVLRAVKANNAGDYYPVWGTCLGFEWLLEIFGGHGAVQRGFDSEHLASNLAFTPAAKGSRLYASANSSLLSWLSEDAITYNNHRGGTTPANEHANAGLTGTFDVLSTSLDRNGREYVAQIEAKALPIYGNQFHPEKVQFVHSQSDPGIPRSPQAVAASRFLAQFFVSEARKSNHTVGVESWAHAEAASRPPNGSNKECACQHPPHGFTPCGSCAAKDPKYSSQCAQLKEQTDCDQQSFVCKWQGITCSTNGQCDKYCTGHEQSGLCLPTARAHAASRNMPKANAAVQSSCCTKCSDACATHDCDKATLPLQPACNCGGTFVAHNHSWSKPCHEMCRMSSYCRTCDPTC